MPPSIGMRFSRFELVSRLASGGMGDVWRARDQDLHRDVAVKFLPERFAADPARLGRFAQEARAASQLNHPNIVTIHEIGETSGLPYIVMELVDGHTLRDLLLSQERRPLPPRRLLEIAAQAADGLAKAHAAGIVHRDLKPENLMVTNDGFVKILDFGLAKLRGDGAMPPGTARRSATGELWFDSGQPTWPESLSPHTAVGAVIGTTGYMSPEQARGLAVDFRSDQFTFGAILYELATGQQAFRRETPAQTIAAIIEDQPEPLATRNPSLPGPLRWVIERCLAKDPAERYASTLDLSRELRGLREHIGEVGGSGSSPAGPLRPVARRRMLTLGLVALVAVPLATWLGPPLIDRATLALGLRPLPEQRHVAVLPFRTASPTPEDRALAYGIAELLTVRLAQLERFRGTLWVEPSSNVAQAGVTSADRAGRALGVTLVVTGSVQRLDGRLLLTATLEDANRNRTLRAATASGIDGLVEAVVSMLALELNASEVAQLRAGRSGVAEAGTLTAQALGYSAWGEARSALDRYEQNQRLESAIELFNRALEHDPRYALAHTGLAEAYWRLYENELKPELVSLAEQHCERALALDDLGPAPWITLGMIHTGSGRAELALADFKKALDRDPRNAGALRSSGGRSSVSGASTTPRRATSGRSSSSPSPGRATTTSARSCTAAAASRRRRRSSAERSASHPTTSASGATSAARSTSRIDIRMRKRPGGGRCSWDRRRSRRQTSPRCSSRTSATAKPRARWRRSPSRERATTVCGATWAPRFTGRRASGRKPRRPTGTQCRSRSRS